MPTAKTYQNMKIQGEPFKENGRMYVNVVTAKGLKKVRWYSEAEYARMYPGEKVESTFNARYAFGFRDEGYITLYKGNENEVRAWAQAEWPPKAWYNTLFQFYTPGFMAIENLPSTITPVRLNWDEVKINDTQMKSDEEIEKCVMAKIGIMANNTSQFQGEKNEWLSEKVIIRENKMREDHFGEKHTHIMVDAKGNTYIWETGTKNYPCNMELKLKMKVKDHKEINGEQCTIVWYCKEV